MDIEYREEIKWIRIQGYDTNPPFATDVHLICLGDTTQEKPVIVKYIGRLHAITVDGPQYMVKNYHVNIKPIAWAPIPKGPVGWLHEEWGKSKAQVNKQRHRDKKKESKPKIAKDYEPSAMQKGQILARLKKVVVDQLGVDLNRVKLEAKFVDDLGADSLDEVELVLATQEEFGIDIDDDEIDNLHPITVGKVRDIVVTALLGK